MCVCSACPVNKSVQNNDDNLIINYQKTPNNDSDSENSVASDKENYEYLDELNIKKSKSCKNDVINLKPIVVVADRYALSERATAAVASATLKSIGIVQSDKVDLVIDRSKIRRKKHSLNRSHSLEGINLNCLAFDGRKDSTLVKNNVDNIQRTKMVKEEHIALLSEPSELLTYFYYNNFSNIFLCFA